MSFIYNNYKFLVMTKSPQLGRVKTRMQPQLSLDQSLELHQALATYAITQWQASQICDMDIWVGGDLRVFNAAMGSLLNENISIYSQVEGDLGDRMAYAVAHSFEQNTQLSGVILLGTDCPFIDKAYLLSAIDVLEAGPDIVIGPALDGGYVLMGLKQPNRALFEQVHWGSDTVFEETVGNISSLNLSYQSLPALSDIDTFEDLSRLAGLKDTLLFKPFYQALATVL